MKAWEKNQPERKGILRAIRNTDVEMPDIFVDEQFRRQQKNLNESYDKIPVDISKKMHAQESRYELLERNKNIFLIAQMLSIKNDEIQKLEDFQSLREEGLK